MSLQRNIDRKRLERTPVAQVVFWLLIGLGAAACSTSSQSSGANNNAGNANAGNGNVGGNGGTAESGGSSGSGGATAGAAGDSSAGSGGDSGGAAAGSAGASGSVGATAGTGGASTAPDAGADGGVACPADAILCDDFESYTTPADLSAAWNVTATMASVVVDTTKPRAGSTQSLHITSSGDTPVGVIIKQDAPLFPIEGNVFYGRMMMWLTQAPTGAVHWNNIQSAGFLPGSTQWSKYGWGGMYGTILAGYTIRTNPTDTQAVTDCSKPSQQGLPEKRWACVEWEFDGAGNQMHLWIDRALVADADIVTTGTQCVTPPPPNNVWQAPTFANLTLGWMQYQASSTPIELWVDDVVVTTKRRVGCPSP